MAPNRTRFLLIVACLLNGFIWAVVIAITAFQSEWLEMRVNMGIILFACWLVLAVGAYVVSRRRSARTSHLSRASRLSRAWWHITVGSVVFSLGYACILLGFKRLAVVPAAIIREGLGMTHVGFALINGVLVAFILLGTLAVFVSSRKK